MKNLFLIQENVFFHLAQNYTDTVSAISMAGKTDVLEELSQLLPRHSFDKF